jgi:hypothetical protein
MPRNCASDKSVAAMLGLTTTPISPVLKTPTQLADDMETPRNIQIVAPLATLLLVGGSCVFMALDRDDRTAEARNRVPLPLAVSASTSSEESDEDGPLENEVIDEALLNDGSIVYRLPETEDEIKSVYRRRRRYSARLIPPGQPLEVSSFTRSMPGVRISGKDAENPARRCHTLSVGITVASSDRSSLPRLSGRVITSYLDSHFISVQSRIVRDPVTRKQYLSPEPIAATGKYGGPSISGSMEAAVQDSISQLRGIGLLMKEGDEDIPENRRTLVMIHRFPYSPAGSADTAEMQHELMFVRARENDRGGLDLHAFSTSGNRTRLNYYGKTRRPRRMSDCNVRASVFFSEYSHASLVPTKGIVRVSEARGKLRYTIEALDASLKSLNPDASFWTDATAALDGIIDGSRR